MKICKSCGALINDDARFCTRCGADNVADVENASQTTVNAEPSAQPQTDYQTAASNDDVYYQPSNDYSNGTPNTYPYQQPTVYQQPTPKKKKFPAWIIVFIVLVVIGGLAAVGSSALKGESDGGSSTGTNSKISAGYNTATEYINSSVNIKIDAAKGDFELMSDEYGEYYGVSEDEFETYICDMDTGDYIYVEILEGNFYDANQDMKKFTEETMEYWYGDDEEIVIGEAYEREIAGKIYTCADVSRTKSDPANNIYAWDTTTCFLREGSTFFEIEITVYPNESSNTIDSIINTYISQYSE